MEALVGVLLEIVGGVLWAMVEGVFVTLVELIVDIVQWIWRTLRGRRGETAVSAVRDARPSVTVSSPAIPDAETATRGGDVGRAAVGLAVNIVLGGVLGCLSVFVLPDHMIASPTIRVAMVPVSAVFCALVVPRILTEIGRSAASALAIAHPRNAFALAFAFSLARLFGAG